MGEEQELPLKSVVLFIAVGTLAFIIVFIFAKRQITRFAVKSSRGPHVSIGADAPKSLRQEIENRLNRAAEIKYLYEPVLLSGKEEELRPLANTDKCHYYYRMKAMDALALLDDEVRDLYKIDLPFLTGHNLRTFLLELRSQGVLQTATPDLINDFADAYDAARHDPSLFGEEEWTNYMILLRSLIFCIQSSRHSNGGMPVMKETAFAFPNLPAQDTNSRLNTTAAQVEVIPAETEPMIARDVADTEEVQVTYKPSMEDSLKGGTVRFTPSSSLSSLNSQHSHHSTVSHRSASKVQTVV